MSKRAITASALRTYLDCPRKYQWSYVEKIRPIRQHDALRFGSLFHDIFEALDKGVEWPDIVHWVHGMAATEVEAEQVLRLTAEHHRHYAGDGYRVIETEGVFDAEIGGVEVAGKRDRIVGLPDGRRALQEYKTSSEDISPGSLYWQRVAMDLQTALYRLSCDVETIVYDVTRKPTIKPREVPDLDVDGLKIVIRDETGERAYNSNGSPRQSAGKGYTLAKRLETPREYGERLTADIRSRPEYYFQRHEIARTRESLAAAADDISDVNSLIRLGLFPKNTAACTRYGRCSYFDQCSANVKPSDGVPVGFQRLDTAHPELA